MKRDRRGRFTREPSEVPRMTLEEITDLARNIVTNVVFIADGPEIELSFPVLIFAAPDMTEGFINTVGAIWEEWRKAGPMGINGNPMFWSCHLVNKDDLPALNAEIEWFERALA